MTLFSTGLSVDDAYTSALGAIRTALTRMSDDQILANDDEELTDHFYEESRLETIEEDPERPLAASEAREVRDVDRSRGRLGPRRVELQFAIIELPLKPKASNRAALGLRGQTFLISDVGEMAEFRERDHVVALRFPLDGTETLLGNLRAMFGYINKDIELHTPSFRPRVLGLVQQRRAEVLAHHSKFDEAMTKLGIEVRRKPGAVEPVNVQIKREIRLLREKPTRSPEPELGADDVRQIVGLIDQSGKGFETTPDAYVSLGEEQLRDVILGHLNAVFGSAAATGETFSKSGKTDIFLRVRDGVALVAECKFWDGAKHYGETIDQIFRYLTWRHTTGVLVTFSRRKGLTNVIDEAKKATTSHPSFSRDLDVIASSYFSSVHLHPNDDEKLLTIHHLFFDMPVG